MMEQDRRSQCGWSDHGQTNNFLNNLMPMVMWVGLVQMQKYSNGIFQVVSFPAPARSLFIVWFWERFNCECKKVIFLSALLMPYSVLLKTGACYIGDVFRVVFARLLCSAEITNDNEFHTSSSPTLCVTNDITSGHAHTLCWNYGFFSEPTWQR